MVSLLNIGKLSNPPGVNLNMKNNKIINVGNPNTNEAFSVPNVNFVNNDNDNDNDNEYV